MVLPMEKPDLVLEGSYSYSEAGLFYSQENFKLLSYPSSQILQMKAEVLARTEVGEFLKIMVNLEMNNHYLPVSMTIERSLGKRFSLESFKVDLLRLETSYLFKNSESEQEHKKPYNIRSYLTSPAISTSALFCLTKKWDLTGRTPIVLVNSDNSWTYQGPPTDKTVYGDFHSGDLHKLEINGQSHVASHLSLYEHDSLSKQSEQPVNFYLNKQYGIPYQVITGDRKIVLTKFKIF